MKGAKLTDVNLSTISGEQSNTPIQLGDNPYKETNKYKKGINTISSPAIEYNNPFFPQF